MTDQHISEPMGKLERLLEAVREELYQQLSGMKQECAFAEIFAKSSVLMEPESWPEIRTSLGGDWQDRLEGLLCLLFVEAAMADRMDSLYASESLQNLRLPGGQRVSLRRAPVAIAMMSDRTARAGVFLKWREAYGAIAGASEAAIADAYSAAGRLGLGSPVDALARISASPAEGIAEQAAMIIDNTTDIYIDILSWIIKKKCGVSLGEAEEHDVFWLAGPAGPVPSVEFDVPLRGIMGNLEAAGIDCTADGRIAVDLESREAKVGNPCCVPVRVPERVRLVGEARDSLDYARLYTHELGCALAYAWTSPRLSFEQRMVVDPSVLHAWGYLLDGVLLDTHWIESLGDYPLRSDWLPVGQALSLIRYRRDAAYVEALAIARTASELAVAYSARVESVLKYKALSSALYGGRGDPLEPAYRVRGLGLGLSLRRHFRDKYGEDWYCNPEAGAMMLSLWRDGACWTSSSLAEALALPPAGFEELVPEIESALGRWH